MRTIGWIVFLSMSGIFFGNAQTMSTREAKMVVVVNPENDTIRALVLFADQDTTEEQLKEKYPDSLFFIGLMEGSYEVVQTMVIPQKGTTIIIFNNQPIFSDIDMVFMEHYSPGDTIIIEKRETLVVSNNKGELILKTQ